MVYKGMGSWLVCARFVILRGDVVRSIVWDIFVGSVSG